MQTAYRRSEVALDDTVVQPDEAIVLAFPETGQKHTIVGFTATELSSDSSRSLPVIRSLSERSNGELTAEARAGIGSHLTHAEATRSAPGEDEPPEANSLDNPSATHKVSHRHSEAVAGGDSFKQHFIVDTAQARTIFFQNVRTGYFEAQAIPKFVNITSLSIACKGFAHLAAIFSTPVLFKDIPNYRQGVKGVQQTNAKLEDVKLGRENNDGRARKNCDDRYKNIRSSNISLEFEQRRNGRRKKLKRAKKARKREARVQLPRGEHPYCSHRAVTTKQREYRSPLRRLLCTCGTPHAVPHAKEWKSSPAEDGWDQSLREDGSAICDTKKVTFAEPVVTGFRVFQVWWEEEYGLSDRYHSRGPFCKSTDLSTKADDDRYIQSMGNLAPQLSHNLTLAASNAIANTSGAINGSAKRTLDRAIPPTSDSINSTAKRTLDRAMAMTACKIKEWWKSLHKFYASRATPVIASGALMRDGNPETV